MSKKTKKNSKSIDTKLLFETTSNFENTIQQTLLHIQKNKNLEIITSNELNSCTNNLEKMFADLKHINELINNIENVEIKNIMEKIQKINNDLGNLFKNYGTGSFSDLLDTCFGKDYTCYDNSNQKNKFFLLKMFFHPIRFKILNWKTNDRVNISNTTILKSRIIEDFTIVEKSENLECFDLTRTSNIFHEKVFGLKLAIHDEKERRTMIVTGIIDNIGHNCIESKFVDKYLKNLKDISPNDEIFVSDDYKNYLKSLSVKEMLIYSCNEINERFLNAINQNLLIKQKNISEIVKDFVGSELYEQRKTLVNLLIKENDHESQYLSYLLYDLMTNDNNGSVDSADQTLLFDSLPGNAKKCFRDAMKQTIQYTSNLSNFDNNKIPMEQQICLMKAPDSVKEKAMNKLKEIKSKTDDTGSKARQYLDGLLKIPFGMYKHEEILQVMTHIKSGFMNIVKTMKSLNNEPLFTIKDEYTNIEIKTIINKIKANHMTNIQSNILNELKNKINDEKRNNLIITICFINNIIKTIKLDCPRLTHSGKKSNFMKEQIIDFIDKYHSNNKVMTLLYQNKEIDNNLKNETIQKEVQMIDNKWNYINNYMGDVRKNLDRSVYGHNKAKRQIERIIAQWINGEQTGYCFGFEGPPGIGKTSFAKKGLAQCLRDENNEPRPFSFIAIGGQDNGSVLNGHNYTYVGSEWGKFVDILMKNDCMNPIIFIDELDKVSKTEHGKEIIGILTHLVDPTQNDTFQDKYFNGIDLDLSRALFIFSYNDAALIDKILLDRIHRVKFDHLSLEDKLVVTFKHILPEIFDKMGLKNMIEISKENVEFIVENYTCEPGVRKFKELLFEIIGEINLKWLQNDETISTDLPIKISNHDIEYIYLKDRHPIREKMIPEESSIGIINGLWANSLGRGGIIPIECKYFPSTTFLDLKLTGMQGDVMKESMNVAKTLAWSLLNEKQMKENIKKYESAKLQGIHIHCPEGATPKDGPSAGTAITTCLYSLFSGRKIKNNIAITGEINLQGKITAIGGLDLKILGGIRGGVKEFIYPKDNSRDFSEFKEKYTNKSLLEDIKFHELESINQVFEIVFEE